MDRKPVKSSNVASIGHDGKDTLEVEFKGGGVYTYHGVDADAHQALMGAKSIGSHLHKNIKGQYKHTKAD